MILIFTSELKEVYGLYKKEKSSWNTIKWKPRKITRIDQVRLK